MADLVDSVGALVRLAGGKIVGKTRLQKTTYLLEVKGLGFGLDFDYHNYGPFSPDLAFATDDAKSLGYITSEEHLGFHSVPYTVFISTDMTQDIGDDAESVARQDALEIMNRNSSLVLELAATAIYLRRNGYPDSFWQEVEKRKRLKATPQRVGLAKQLIAELRL